MQLFGFDAALDEDVAFALDPESAELLTDCLVPNDEPDTAHEVSQPCVPFKQEFEEPELEAQPVHMPVEPTAAAPAVSPACAAPMAAHVPPMAFTLPSGADNIPNVDNYIPLSLIPVDALARSASLAERREKVQRFKEKKKNRQFKKLIRYASRKRYAEVRPRIKGRFARKDEIAAAKAAGVPLE